MRRFAIALMAALLSACSGGTVSAGPVPEPPAATLERPARSPWGDAQGARVGRLAAHLHDQLHDRYGAVREAHYVGRDPAAVEGLEQWYAGRLSGWSAKPLSLPPEEHGFAFVAGDRAFAIGWLDRLPDGRVPVVTMRYGKDG